MFKEGTFILFELLCHYTVAFKQCYEGLKFLHCVPGLVEGYEEEMEEWGRGSRTLSPASI